MAPVQAPKPQPKRKPVKVAKADRETRALLDILELGRQDILAGRVTPAADVLASLRAKIAEKAGMQ
jgi:hypothetical protein